MWDVSDTISVLVQTLCSGYGIILESNYPVYTIPLPIPYLCLSGQHSSNTVLWNSLPVYHNYLKLHMCLISTVLSQKAILGMKTTH